MSLTDLECRKTQSTEKLTKLSDTGGLQLWIYPNGTKVWRFAYRFGGKQKLLTLGRYPATTLLQARMGRDNAKVLLDAAIQAKNGFEIETHSMMAPFEWTSARIKLHLTESQRKGQIGHAVRAELAGKKVLNACVLDFLIANPNCIPQAWLGKTIAFWGTIYRAANGNLCVRVLDYRRGHWVHDYEWLQDRWYDEIPAIVLQN